MTVCRYRRERAYRRTGTDCRYRRERSYRRTGTACRNRRERELTGGQGQPAGIGERESLQEDRDTGQPAGTYRRERELTGGQPAGTYRRERELTEGLFNAFSNWWLMATCFISCILIGCSKRSTVVTSHLVGLGRNIARNLIGCRRSTAVTLNLIG